MTNAAIDLKYRSAVRVWRNAWPKVMPFFTMRKYRRNRHIVPSDESAMNSLYLAIRESSKRWRGLHHWTPAMQVFQILFGKERVPLNA